MNEATGQNHSSLQMKDLEDCDDYTSESSDEYTLYSTSESDCDAVNDDDDCHTTISDTIHGPTSEVSDSEEEPCSSQNTKHGVVVSAYQKRDGSRVYNKRHYCLYCCKPYAKMARHLEGAHANKCDVAKALSYPKGSKERRKQLDHIRNRGNYAHNAAVLKSGKGELVPSKRPSKEAQGQDFMHCAYCQGLFIRRVLWRHMRTCRLQPPSESPKRGRRRIQFMCAYKEPPPSNMSKQLWEVMSAMNSDPITDVIKHDKVIKAVGQHLLNKGGMSDKNKQYVRQKMRELGRLVCTARRVTSLKALKDCIHPKNYTETVKAVKYTCGYDCESDKFTIPSLANKLGKSLVKASQLLKAQGLISNNKQLVKNTIQFQEVHREKWYDLISATALRNMREAKCDVPTLMSFTEDVQKLHTYVGQMLDRWYESLSENPSTKAWRELAKVCLAQVILLNRRREGEVASVLLSAFLSRDTFDPYEDVDWALSEVEKVLCRHLSRISARGTCARPLPVLLTPKMLCALELLVKQREACGVLKDNTYVFARPEAMTHFPGSRCLRGYAKACGATHPKSLTSVRLRKHAATLSTVLNMTNSEMEQLASFLGHHLRIHREFYRHPEKTQQLAKMCKVLMALEQGRLAEFYGRSFDEITINPDEPILEWDEKDRSIQPGHVCIGKTTGKKNPWQPPEVQAVERHMMHFITSCTVPAKSDCEKCLRAEPDALKNRDWKNLKFFIYNRITAYKRRLECK
ncbi:uncharacterized protein LOC130436722 isoform X2 [Triplophysa dalaica]|nr:uncharacterized protein LOC130436722 isoform X2 [Triplophysa dalaica]XP_056623630.1 uncharacterized protein LOC130436722 isoform X2 [Triplophysa dalaica]